MGTIKQGICGDFTGKVGNVVGYRSHGKNYIRTRPGQMRNPRTEAQQRQRRKFAAAFGFLRSMSPFIRLGYALYGKDKTPFNAAMSYVMKKAVRETDDEVYIDFRRILVATGTLMPVFEASATVEDRKIVFTWADNSGTGNAEATDTVMLLAYNTASGEAWYLTEAARRADGRGELPIPPTWRNQRLAVYLCLRNEAEGMVSNSLCLMS